RRLWLLPLALISGAPAERRSRRTRPGRGAAHECAAFSAGPGWPFRKSRRLRGPDAQRRARRRGVLSLRQVSLHKQRKVARAVTARKLLILISTRTAGGSRSALRPLPRREERVGGVAPTYDPVSVTDIVRPCHGNPRPTLPRYDHRMDNINGETPELLYQGEWLRMVKRGQWESCERTHGKDGLAVLV